MQLEIFSHHNERGVPTDTCKDVTSTMQLERNPHATGREESLTTTREETHSETLEECPASSRQDLPPPFRGVLSPHTKLICSS